MTQTIVCNACSEVVPYGRLSCPNCGEMLASVAGTRRAEARAATATATPDVLHDAPSASGAGAAPAVDVEADVVPPPIIVGGARWDASDAGFDALLAGSAAASTAAPPVGGSVTPSAPSPTPGAYVPPPPVIAAAPPPVAGYPAGPSAPARAWGGRGASETSSAGASGDGAATGDAASSGDVAALLGGARATEFVRWLTVAGAALVIAGMILPWSSLTVIGAEGVGYFDRWGLAGPGHLLVVVAVLALLAGALMRDRVPAWLGIGLPGLGIGGLLLGLTWPYLIGPLGGQLGAFAVALGAILLMAAGVAALVVDRHERGDRVV